MWPLETNDIEQLHFDLTNFCNAKCPECVREIDDYCWPFLDKDMLSLDLIRERFTKEQLPRLNYVRFCGSFGDPLTHPKLYEITKHFIDEWPNIKIVCSTNGGLKNTNTWNRLAELYTGKRWMVFGIDGLEDTNHLYRVGVNWKKLQENFRAFIKAGGHAQWQYIVFPWNEHQFMDARSFSIDEGFYAFFIIKSHRNSDVNNKYSDKNYIQMQYDLLEKISKKRENKVNDLDDYEIIKKDPTRKILPPNTTDINCEAIGHRDIMIMATGEVYPCCHLGARMFSPDPKLELWREMAGGRSTFNLKNHTMDEIIKGKFFTLIHNSWALPKENNLSSCKGCIQSCANNQEGIDKRYVL